MAIAYIGIAIGVLIAIILIVKLLRTPAHEHVSVESRCKKCGQKIEGMRCSRCDKDSRFGV